MTDRLSALLHEEAERLDVPMPAAEETLAAGRRVRRRRRATQTVAVVTAVACIGTGATLLGGGPQRADDGVAEPGPADPQGQSLPSDVGQVFAVGDTVYLQGGGVSARMDEVAQTLYYTSAGLLVRTNKDGASDGGAPFHFALVSPEGTVSKLGLTLGEVVPSTDPGQPYLAYADAGSGEVQVVVLDVSTDAEVARVDVPGVPDWGGWEAPPVALDGEDVFVSSQTGTQVVNWRTGEVTTNAAVPGGYPDVHGGRAIVRDRREVRIVDARTGSTVLAVPTTGDYALVRLSPDGRLATVVSDRHAGQQGRRPLHRGHRCTRPGRRRPVRLGLDRAGPVLQRHSRTGSSAATQEGRSARPSRCPTACDSRVGPVGRRRLRELRLSRRILSISSQPPAPYVVNTCPGIVRGPDERDHHEVRADVHQPARPQRGGRPGARPGGLQEGLRVVRGERRQVRRLRRRAARIETATTIKHGDDGPVVVDGPFNEAKEVVGGFSVIDVADMDAAVSLVKTWPQLGCPAWPSRSGRWSRTTASSSDATAAGRRTPRGYPARGVRPAGGPPGPAVPRLRPRRGGRAGGGHRGARGLARDGAPRNPAAWLQTAARHNALDLVRRRTR